jgi:enhancer of mRNA-decapping protein 4
MEVLGNSAATALQPSVQLVYKDIFTNLVVPSFEKSCQSMFQQINESFSKGTKECKFPYLYALLCANVSVNPV